MSLYYKTGTHSLGTAGVARSLARLGSNLKTARLRRRISVQDSADRVGVSARTITRLERGDEGVGIGTLATACLVLGELDRFTGLLDPATDDTGLLMDREALPKRIVGKGRSRAVHPRKKKRDRLRQTMRKGSVSDARGGRRAGRRKETRRHPALRKRCTTPAFAVRVRRELARSERSLRALARPAASLRRPFRVDTRRTARRPSRLLPGCRAGLLGAHADDPRTRWGGG